MKRAFYVLILAALILLGCRLWQHGIPDLTTALPEPTLSPLRTPILAPLIGPILKNPQLLDFHMLDELNGWGISDNAILRTNNGGASWHSVTPPGMAPLGYNATDSFPQNECAFILIPDPSDPMHAGTLYRTEDGGRTWSSNSVPFGTAQIHFLDFNQGWAMAGLGVAAGSNAIAVYQTIDGGKTWTRNFINDPTLDSSSDEIPLGGLKTAFFPLNMETAWVGGVIYAPGTPYLYRTDDGGRHWRPVNLQPPPGSQEAQLSIESIQFVSTSDGFLSMQVTQNTLARVLYATHDGGGAWIQLPEVFTNGRAEDFVSKQDALVFDGEQFHVTRDGGESWTRVEPDVVFSDSFVAMDFVNAQTGWIISRDPATSTIRLYKTTDGGTTWELQ